jgi:DNA polymerase-3 subunit delta'
MKRFMEQIVQNDGLKNRICSDILMGSFSHAYIIEGVKGSGKHTIARLSAAALSCERKNDDSAPLPCGKCEACRKILEFLSPDVITVGTEGKATLGVDSIRFMREDVYTPPNDLEHKIYIIEDADKMTVQAQNAFLLTLEEPPAYAGFILLCENAGALLETIRSRAPILRTEPISRQNIDRYITANDKRAATLKASAPKDYAELIAASENGIGKALSLLEPKELSPILERRRLAKDFISLATSNGSHKDAFALLSRFSQKRDALSEELKLIYVALRDLAILKKSENAELCFYETKDAALEASDAARTSELFRLISTVSDSIDSITRNANVRLTMISLMSEIGML